MSEVVLAALFVAIVGTGVMSALTTGYTFTVTDLVGSITVEMTFNLPGPLPATYTTNHTLTSNGSRYFSHSGGGTFGHMTVYSTTLGNVSLAPGNFASFKLISTGELFDVACGISGWTGHQGNVPIRGGYGR